MLSHDGLRDEIPTLLAYQHRAADQLPSDTRRPRGYDRFVLLAAPLLGEHAPVPRQPHLSTRQARLADAIDAELSGDRERAATILHGLVADPTWFWDFPERAALIRNLSALGRFDEIAKLCADTLAPAVFRPAFLGARATCRAAIAAGKKRPNHKRPRSTR